MKAILIGFMGSGKTTVGKLLAAHLTLPHVDLDKKIVEYTGKEIKEIFSQYGEKKFRELEQKTLVEQLDKKGVLSTGGGTPISEQNLKILQAVKTPVILLETSLNTVLKRVAQSQDRPIINQLSKNELLELYNQRAPFYQRCADLRVTTDNRSPLEIVEWIKNNL